MDLFKRAGDESLARTKEAQWRLTWSLEDELRSLRGLQVLIDAMRLARTNRAFAAALAEQRIKLADLGFQLKPSDLRFDVEEVDLRTLFSEGVISVSRLLNRVLAADAVKQLAITAIALKRYHLRNGTYPVDLNALVPQFVSELPRDPVNGQPLRYRVAEEQSFLLYSVGDDGKDDEGDPKHSGEEGRPGGWLGGRDWVWPQPASPDEVKAYRDECLETRPLRRLAEAGCDRQHERSRHELGEVTPANPFLRPFSFRL